MVFFRNNHNKKGIARKKNQEGERREGEGRNTKGGKWSQEIRWVGGVSHKISFDSFRKKNKNKKTAIIHHFSPPSKVGTMRKRKERATKEGMPKGGRGQDCLFLLRRGSGKERMGIKTE